MANVPRHKKSCVEYGRYVHVLGSVTKPKNTNTNTIAHMFVAPTKRSRVDTS